MESILSLQLLKVSLCTWSWWGCTREREFTQHHWRPLSVSRSRYLIKVSCSPCRPTGHTTCMINLLPGCTTSRLCIPSKPERLAMEKYIRKSLASGIIRPSSSPVGEGFFFVVKKVGRLLLIDCSVFVSLFLFLHTQLLFWDICCLDDRWRLTP